jgi:hypothetical protein
MEELWLKLHLFCLNESLGGKNWQGGLKLMAMILQILILL